jgi:hypothetical protein
VLTGEESMLGPALTQLLGRLAVIPQKQRTEEQEALFTELHLLFVALPDRPKLTHVELDVQLRQILPSAANNIVDKMLSYTKPYEPKPVPSAEQCKKCNQNFPVMTQPSA